MKKLIYAFLILFSVNAFAGEWIKDSQTGCEAYDPEPGPNETISWPGGCVEGKAGGAGALKFFLSGKPGPVLTCTFSEGKCTGKGSLLFPSGNRYEGDFINGAQTGKGVFTWSTGGRYEGDFVDGALTGQGIRYQRNGDKITGKFIGGKLSGEGVFTWANGLTQNGKFSPDGKQWIPVSKSDISDNDFDFDNSVGVFTDKRTGLMWRRCALGRTWEPDEKICSGDGTKTTWADMVRLVHKEKYAKFTDWRLPTVLEYESLISAKSTKNCDALKKVVKQFFPNVFSPNMFGSNHWLADNTGDLTVPSSADLEVVTGMLGCKSTENALKAHSLQPAIMVRGGTQPQEWTFALSKMHLSKQINAKSEAEHKKYWNGVNKKVNDFLTAPKSSSSSGNANSYCSTSDTCFETVSTREDVVTIRCTKGNNIGGERKIHGPDSNGKWANGMLGGYHRNFRETGNFACE